MKTYTDLISRLANEAIPPDKLPDISIVMPAHNEEKEIPRKLLEISKLEYPRDRMEIVLVDDCSTDETVHVAQETISKLGLRFRMLRNSQRMGVNACYNRSIGKCSGELILTTDVDVTLSADALRKGVNVLRSLDHVGAVTAKTVTVPRQNGAATAAEKSYRRIFEGMFVAESAIHSTFPGYTACMIFRRSLFAPIATQHGSSDGNISLMIIRKDMRFICVPEMLFYERVSGRFGEQRAQKVRRAARLIQSMMRNRDMAFNGRYGEFGWMIFPLRFGMMILCPPAVVIGIICTLLWIIFVCWPLALIVLCSLSCLALASMRGSYNVIDTIGSLILHEIYLLLGLLRSHRAKAVWDKSSEEESRPNPQ